MEILNKYQVSEFGTLFEKKFLEETLEENRRFETFDKNTNGVDFSFGKGSCRGKIFTGLQIELKVTTGPDFRIRYDKRVALVEQAQKADVFLIAIVPEEMRELCLKEEYKILAPLMSRKGREEERIHFCVIPSRDVTRFYSYKFTKEKFGSGIMPLDRYAKQPYRVTSTSDDGAITDLCAIRDQKMEIFREKIIENYRKDLSASLRVVTL